MLTVPTKSIKLFGDFVRVTMLNFIDFSWDTRYTCRLIIHLSTIPKSLAHPYSIMDVDMAVVYETVEISDAVKHPLPPSRRKYLSRVWFI